MELTWYDIYITIWLQVLLIGWVILYQLKFSTNAKQTKELRGITNMIHRMNEAMEHKEYPYDVETDLQMYKFKYYTEEKETLEMYLSLLDKLFSKK